MTYKALTMTPMKGLDRSDSLVERLHEFSLRKSADLATGSDYDNFLTILNTLRSYSRELTVIKNKNIVGLNDFAKDQRTDPAYDLKAEQAAIIVLVDAAADEIVRVFPKDESGKLLGQTIGADAVLDEKYSAALLATVKSKLDDIIAGIV